jgi:hypothetical protein
MRFDGKAALALGILLPMLETCRRGLGTWRTEFTTMFEDYFAGALLLAGAWAAYQGRKSAAAILLLAWAWVTGMMTNSFVDQVEGTMRGVDLEPYNTVVLVVKFVLLALSASALLGSFRRVTAQGLIQQ